MKYSLVNVNGNTFCLISHVTSCMKKEKISKEKREEFAKNILACKSYKEVVNRCQSKLDELNNLTKVK